MSVLTVGIVAAGAVTQAIHIPTLARLPHLFRLTHVVDVDPTVAEAVAGRSGAKAGTDPFAMIADPDVDVVAICSPHAFHAEQVIAACEAGKLAVLCEKPLVATLDEARAIAAASQRTGVPVLTATMHGFDPAFVAASEEWPEADRPRLIESMCFLPPNDVFVDQATQLFVGASPGGPRPGATSAQLFESAVLGLASHHIPLVRRFLPTIDRVTVAAPLQPWGYDITLHGEDAIARLMGLMPESAVPDWTLSVTGETSQLEVDFPPSYVQAGSAVAALRTGTSTTKWSFDESGYVAEWRVLHDLAERRSDPGPLLESAIADFAYAEQILSAFAVLEGAGA